MGEPRSDVYITVDAIEAHAQGTGGGRQQGDSGERELNLIGCICAPFFLLIVFAVLFFILGPMAAREFGLDLPVAVPTIVLSGEPPLEGMARGRNLLGNVAMWQTDSDAKYCAEYYPGHELCIVYSTQPVGTFMRSYPCNVEDIATCTAWVTKRTKWGQEVNICSKAGDFNTCYSQIRQTGRRLAPETRVAKLDSAHTTPHAADNYVRAPLFLDADFNTSKMCDKCLEDIDKCNTWTYMTCEGSPKPLMFVFCIDVFLKDILLGVVFTAAAIAARSDPVAEMISEPCFFSIAYIIDVLRWMVVTFVAFYAALVVLADITQCVESVKHNCGFISYVMAFWFWVGVSSSCALGLLCFADLLFLLCTRPSALCGPDAWYGRRGEERRARMLYTLCCVLLICFSYWVAYIWSKGSTCPY